MTGETNRPRGGWRDGARESGGGDESVTALHARWLRIQNRLTGAPLGHEPKLSKEGRRALAEEGRALERRIAAARARGTAEVILKLKLSACPLLLTGEWRELVESAARDLKAGFRARG